MKKLLVLIFLIISYTALCQKDTTLFIGVNGKPGKTDSAEIKKEVKFRPGKKMNITTSKYRDGKWVKQYVEQIKISSENVYEINISGKEIDQNLIRKYEAQPEGLFRFTESDGRRILKTGFTKTKIPLILHGEVTEYYPGGELKAKSVYRSNQLVSNENWLENGEKYIDNIFYSVDDEPIYSPGVGRFHDHVLKAFKASNLDISGVKGTLLVGFVVMETGEIEGVRILKGITPKLNETVTFAMKTLEGEWKPARLNNRNVRYFQLFPINFIYDEYRTDYVELNGSMLFWGVN